MTPNSQLLCSFATISTLEDILSHITKTYSVLFDSIYVLSNTEIPDSLCCTYNIDPTVKIIGLPPLGTISLHRKKGTNTLFTINAINTLVMELNNGIMDKNYVIPWEKYRNTILVTMHGKFRRINTKLLKIVKAHEIGNGK